MIDIEKGDIVTLNGGTVGRVTDVADGWVEGHEDKRETAFVYVPFNGKGAGALKVADRSEVTYNQTASQRQTEEVLAKLRSKSA